MEYSKRPPRQVPCRSGGRSGLVSGSYACCPALRHRIRYSDSSAAQSQQHFDCPDRSASRIASDNSKRCPGGVTRAASAEERQIIEGCSLLYRSEYPHGRVVCHLDSIGELSIADANGHGKGSERSTHVVPCQRQIHRRNASRFGRVFAAGACQILGLAWFSVVKRKDSNPSRNVPSTRS